MSIYLVGLKMSIYVTGKTKTRVNTDIHIVCPVQSVPPMGNAPRTGHTFSTSYGHGKIGGTP